MNGSEIGDGKRRWFFWGIALALLPSLPTLIGLTNAFSGIVSTKATGLAAVAGGLAETYVTCGLLTTLILPVVAIVCLVKSCSRDRALRTAIAVLSIAWSALLLAIFGFGAWLYWVYIPRQSGGPH
jgi:hypothetical protein